MVGISLLGGKNSDLLEGITHIPVPLPLPPGHCGHECHINCTEPKKKKASRLHETRTGGQSNVGPHRRRIFKMLPENEDGRYQLLQVKNYHTRIPFSLMMSNFRSGIKLPTSFRGLASSWKGALYKRENRNLNWFKNYQFFYEKKTYPVLVPNMKQLKEVCLFVLFFLPRERTHEYIYG